MKYFKEELWKAANSTLPEVRQVAEEQWGIADREYYEYFNSIKENLSKSFLRKYQLVQGFHDFVLVDISIENIVNNSCDIFIMLQKNEQKYSIGFLKVISYSFNVPNGHVWRQGKLTWGYDEIELNSDESWTMRILCDKECEFQISAKKFMIKSLN